MAKKFYDSNSRSAMKQAGSMISEDRSAPCNLPRNVIDKEYPSHAYAMSGQQADLYAGVTKQMSEDRGDLKKTMKLGLKY